MRQDQFERLQTLEEKLTDVFLGEADPEQWPGHGIDPVAMDQKTRADRYRAKRAAAETLVIVQRTASLVHTIRLQSSGADAGTAGVEDAVSDLDDEVNAAEREANKLLAKLQDPQQKAKLDKKVHGRAS